MPKKYSKLMPKGFQIEVKIDAKIHDFHIMFKQGGNARNYCFYNRKQHFSKNHICFQEILRLESLFLQILLQISIAKLFIMREKLLKVYIEVHQNKIYQLTLLLSLLEYMGFKLISSET